ncbi:MAG: hypothetical protein AAF557_14730 [Pseudomonadota bacterium]
MRFVTKQIHAYLDYPVALGLIVMPFVLGLGASSPLAVTASIATGIAALILTILTDHETGLVRLVPYSFHLIVDALVGVAFTAAPFALGFAGLDAAYYWIIGATVLVVVGLHQPERRLQTA